MIIFVGDGTENSTMVKATYLNGEIVPNCIYADTEEGKVKVYKTNKYGNVFINHDTKEIEIEEKNGKVQIVMLDGTIYE